MSEPTFIEIWKVSGNPNRYDREEEERMVKTMEKIRVCPVCGFVGYAEDAVEVVRCSECKHLHPSGRCEEFADDGIRPSATDFCSYGKRREDDEA